MNKTEAKHKVLVKSQWREIVALNFEVERRSIQPLVPKGTRLDTYHNNAFVTLMARNSREVQPYGRSFTLIRSVDEICLRFYVYREVDGQLHRGFCHLRGFTTSKWASRLAKWMFGQPFELTSIKRQTQEFDDARTDSRPVAEYQWNMNESPNLLKVLARSQVRRQAEDTKEHFFLHHDYMYVQKKKGTMEYPISHAPWLVWDAASGSFDCDMDNILGEDFRKTLRSRPSSVLLCRGGELNIHRGRMIPS